jgi:hypothetical protein
VELKLCELKIKGSLNITSDSSNAYLAVSTFSHLSVSGDLSILGSYAPDSTFLYWDSIVEVRPHPFLALINLNYFKDLLSF